MPNYLRAKFEGGYYFFTVVTYQRRKLFDTATARRCLREAIELSFIRASAFIWKLPDGDADFSKRWDRKEQKSILLLWNRKEKRGHSAFMRRLSILLVLGAAVSSIHCAGGAQRPAKALPQPKHGDVYVVAHRGAHDGIPENTLAAVDKSIYGQEPKTA